MTESYVVERIEDKKVANGVTFYFIKWKGFSEDNNTWEPLKNLDGCPDVLKAFEKREAKSAGRRARGAKLSNAPDDKEVDKELAETAKHMKSYGILRKWPADKEPLCVEGVLFVDGKLTYIVKKKIQQRSAGLTRNNAILVHAEDFRQHYPELVIKFYESRVFWSENAKLDEEQASVASQSTLLHQNLGSRRGKMISNDIDCKLRETYNERKETDIPVKQEVKEVEDRAIEDDEDVEEGEEVEDFDEKSDCEDNFGLPNNLQDVSSDDDGTSGSESEMEEVDIERKQDERNWKRSVNQDESDDDTWNWKRLNKTGSQVQVVNGNCDGEMSAY